MDMATLPDIGLAGRMRVGKTTAAEYLRDHYGYTIIGFADPVRSAISALNPIVDQSGLRYRAAVDTYGYDGAKDQFPEVRRLLQNWGMTVRDHVSPDLWANVLRGMVEKLDADQPVVVPDVRFRNELQVLSELGFVTARLTRATAPVQEHESEGGLDDATVDYEYANNRTVGDLWGWLDFLVGAGTF